MPISRRLNEPRTSCSSKNFVTWQALHVPGPSTAVQITRKLDLEAAQVGYQLAEHT